MTIHFESYLLRETTDQFAHIGTSRTDFEGWVAEIAIESIKYKNLGDNSI